jgi:transcriptional regulator with XRE-family HTH domain
LTYVSRWDNMILMKRIGRNVRLQRQARKWTQAELARRVGTSRIYVAQIEAASKEISIAMLERLARALKVPVTTLVK